MRKFDQLGKTMMLDDLKHILRRAYILGFSIYHAKSHTNKRINNNAAISFLLWIDAMTFSLSLTVGNVEFPIAACSGFQASFNKRSNALLCPKSTRAACSSVLRSDIVSSYN
jgi:hypothetical protein